MDKPANTGQFADTAVTGYFYECVSMVTPEGILTQTMEFIPHANDD